MVLGRASLFIRNGLQNLNNGNFRNSQKFILGFLVLPVRNMSCVEVTKNMSVLSNEKKTGKIVNFKLIDESEKPLVVLLSWLMARKKHTAKYAQIYLDKGFDVLNVTCNPWQFLWPVKGTQIVAADILKFLEQNQTYQPIILHGFSVGGYLWGECMVQIKSEQDRYQPILNRIVGQVWDSAADVTEIHKGVPPAVFPRNKLMQNALGQYMMYHLKTFDKVATTHYVRSSQMFHTNLVKAPALMLLSKTDTIGTEESNNRVRENWESMGIPVTWKVFEKSPHVGHFRKYPKEYTSQIQNFLDSLPLPQSQNLRQKDLQKIEAKQ